MVFHHGQAGEDVVQVGVGIDAPAAAAFDDGVDDGSALACSGFANEEPVLFSHRGWADGVFDEVVVDLHSAITEEYLQGVPLAERIINGAAKEALGKVLAALFEH